MTIHQVLFLGLLIKSRFRCKQIAHKPDAHSWSVERDIVAGFKLAWQMNTHGPVHPIIDHCEATKRSITTLTPADINEFDSVQHETTAQLVQKAVNLTVHLQAQGWEKKDFAAALKQEVTEGNPLDALTEDQKSELYDDLVLSFTGRRANP